MPENMSTQKKKYKFLKTLKNEIIYGGHLSSLVAPAFILSVSILMNRPVDLTILAIAYLMPLIVYSYDYYGEIDKDRTTNPERVDYIDKKIKIFPYLICFYIVLLVSLLFVYGNYGLMICVFILTLSGIVYGRFFKDLTKKIIGFKNIYTALIWASTGTFLLLFSNSVEFSVAFVQIFNFIYFKVIINVIFYDLKDLESDKEHGLKTLPVMLGNDGTLKFLHALNLFAFLPLAIGVYIEMIPVYALSLIVLYFYDLYYLVRANSANSKKIRTVSCILADAEFILWPILLVIGRVVCSSAGII
ncbi:prenyltransferase [Methanocella sp. CWC-04]|uniref:Prenyltransferase n=1 Tax=Methanooceanicella nereidis TaxID=2052831 RepID=A0AAP2W8A1_9EURY|nr:UbiA family prenyltransferase [Methanocella sp. CWC-04]MCD1295856.1 prenyltransferase [Methanocella sp. CWC-04]